MNILLWILQVLLGVYFILIGVGHFIIPPNLPPMMAWMYELPPWLHWISGTAEILGGLGLILPAVTRIQTRTRSARRSRSDPGYDWRNGIPYHAWRNRQSRFQSRSGSFVGFRSLWALEAQTANRPQRGVELHNRCRPKNRQSFDCRFFVYPEGRILQLSILHSFIT